MKHISLLFCLLSALFCGKAFSAEVVIGDFNIIYGEEKGDNPLFDRGYNDALKKDLDKDKLIEELGTKFPFTDDEKREIELAVAYWAERLGAGAPVELVHIYTGSTHDPGSPNPEGSAFSISPTEYLLPEYTAGISASGTVFDKFIPGRKSPYPPGLADNIIIFETGYDSTPTRLLLRDDSIMATMLHELGHALGIVGTHTVIDNDKEKGRFDPENFTAWNSHLHDVFGTVASPGMLIKMNVTSSSTVDEPDVFQLYSQNYTGPILEYEYPTFHGNNVNALTGPKGMPVMGGFSNDGPGLDGANSLGHPGLTQSIMSYGIIRNMPFTEMELAAFQDLGYAIDRSQFFGKSYYYEVGDDVYGTERVNTTPFGTADRPNTAIFGLGAHIMRDGLTLTQAADIYAGGYGGGGVRIDGVKNKLTIPHGVSVTANGQMGTGLLVSYGSGNEITLDGRVEALGPGGIGAHFGIMAAETRFDIRSHMPDPSLGNPPDYAALPIQQKYELLTARDDLSGALVDNFTISGRLAGTQAAIQIEKDAHVKSITVLDGALISGHIVSYWERNTGGGPEPYTTAFAFGQKDAGGSMRLDGDIVWNKGGSGGPENSLDITQYGGHLNYNGNANVHSWKIESGASLGGDNTIKIEGPLPFFNDGLISPGNSGSIGEITIEGGYTQGASGGLLMNFTSTATDKFIVIADPIDIDIQSGATLSLQALPDFYATGSERVLTGGDLLSSNMNMTAFTQELLPVASPTLITYWSELDPGSPVFHVTRATDAYSRHDPGASGASVGRALDRISARAAGDMQNLFAAIDFSSPDGSTVRSALRQLAPTAYDNTAQSSFDSGRVLASSIFTALDMSAMPAASGYGAVSSASGYGSVPSAARTRPQAFVLPQGGLARQRSRGDLVGYDAYGGGLVGGVNWNFDSVTAGFHLSYEHRRLDTDTSARVSTDGVSLGLQAAFRPDSGFFAHGLVNLGLENTRMRRPVNFNGYLRESKSKFTSWTTLAATRAGWEWQAGGWHFGPRAGLEWGGYFRPSVTESGGGASSLHLGSDNFHSLRTALGAGGRMNMRTRGGLDLQAGFSAEWIHETLGLSNGARASFVGYRDEVFQGTNRAAGRDALALRGMLGLTTENGLRLGAFAGTELFRSGYVNFEGGFSISRSF